MAAEVGFLAERKGTQASQAMSRFLFYFVASLRAAFRMGLTPPS